MSFKKLGAFGGFVAGFSAGLAGGPFAIITAPLAGVAGAVFGTAVGDIIDGFFTVTIIKES